MLRALRQPRYAALSALMVIVAAICVAAGTWQIARLHTKAVDNSQLRHNAHQATAPVADVLPIASPSTHPRRDAVQFRTVTATGEYDNAASGLVRNRTVNSTNGYLVLTPLRTTNGVLLVVRGFLPSNSATPPPIPDAPSGQVTITGRVQPADTSNDAASRLTHQQLESINPVQQGRRLGTPAYAGYVELFDGQPGVGDIKAMPKPDLSNPAGGAIEPQHLAYIIQWYLFALLALAAPLAMVRAETRLRPSADIDHEPAPAPAEPATEPTPEQLRAAKLADRYGRAVR